MPTEPNINLIKCADHKLAPWSIVCVHLVEGTSQEWVGVASGNPEVDFGWLCPECARRLPEADVEDLKAICIHCVRLLRQRFDPAFTADG